MVPVLSLSTLLRLQVASKGNFPKQALRCVHFPGLSCSGSGSPQRHRLGWACILCPSQIRGAQATRCLASTLSQLCRGLITSLAPVAQFTGCATRAPSQVCRVSPLGGWSQVATLLADVNRPISQEDVVCNWEPAPSLVEDAISGAKIAPRLPALAVVCLPLCLWCGGGAGWQPASSPLAFSQSFVLWEGQNVA